MPLILIVDDSPTEVHVMQKALEKHGYRTAAAADGAEGVRLAREMSPDLIFMDIVMPGMNGYQATRALANDPRTRTIPIIMVTSKGQETDRIWGLRQGAVDYMVKPVSPDQLVAKAQVLRGMAPIRSASAFWIASRVAIGRIGKSSRAFLSRTTVGFFSPSIKCLPISNALGVTKASQRLDRYGVSTGTEISHRRSPF